MRIKWLVKLDSILLDQICSIHRQPSTAVDLSSMNMIIENFLKLFIVRHGRDQQDELSFYQTSLTSYLRFLFLEFISTSSSFDELLSLSFDLLFDLIDVDLCQSDQKEKFRSSLIEDDYFHPIIQIKSKHRSASGFRLKTLLYFIELIGFKRRRCSMPFVYHGNENHLFQSIQQTIEHLVDRSQS